MVNNAHFIPFNINKLCFSTKLPKLHNWLILLQYYNFKKNLAWKKRESRANRLCRSNEIYLFFEVPWFWVISRSRYPWKITKVNHMWSWNATITSFGVPKYRRKKGVQLKVGLNEKIVRNHRHNIQIIWLPCNDIRRNTELRRLTLKIPVCFLLHLLTVSRIIISRFWWI